MRKTLLTVFIVSVQSFITKYELIVVLQFLIVRWSADSCHMLSNFFNGQNFDMNTTGPKGWHSVH